MNQTAVKTRIQDFQTFTSIEGVFENGQIKPLIKKLPFKAPQRVIIVFLESKSFTEEMPQKTIKKEKLTNQTLKAMDKEDKRIWKAIEPTYRRVRGEVFKEQYPKLYKKYYAKKN